jgi:1-acyl-sn-glycerol-3-phosphate acyltransferase
MSFSTIIRTFSIWVLGWLFTGVMIPIGIITFLFDPVKQRLVQPLIRFWARTMLLLSFNKVTVLGLENIKGLKAGVFAGNHQSMLDIFLYLGNIPINGGFLAKKQILFIPFIGQLAVLFGHIVIDRSNPKKSLASVERCIKAVKKGWSIFIYPEGTRTDNGEISVFKSGSLKIPMRTEAPVVPVTVSGVHKVLTKHTLRINKGHMVISFGKPMETKGLEVKDFKPFVKKLEDKVRAEKERIDALYPELN